MQGNKEYMNKLRYFGFIVLMFSLFLFNCYSEAAPIPRGSSYEITAKVLSVNNEAKAQYLTSQN